MSRQEQEENTLDYYNHQAQDHLQFRGEGVSQYWSQELARFQELLPQGSVLEIGCGTGNEAILLQSMGYDYTGLDLSIGMLSIAKHRSPEAKLVCQDLRLSAIDRKFDGLIAIASLLHLEKEELTPALATLRRQLRSDGIALISLKEGQDCEIDSKGRFFSYYSIEELSRHLNDAGFNLIDLTVHPEKYHNFICCFVENP